MDQISPDDLQKMLALAQEIQTQQMAARNAAGQAERADAMGAAPQATTYGGMTTAPHWTQYLGALAHQGIAGKQRQAEQEAMQRANQGQGQQNQMLMAALLRGQQGQPSPQLQKPVVDPFSGLLGGDIT